MNYTGGTPARGVLCKHGVSYLDICSECVEDILNYMETERMNTDKLQPTGEVKDELGRTLTPHKFACFILDNLNENIRPSILQVQTLCLMVQHQATQLRQIKEMAEIVQHTTVHLEQVKTDDLIVCKVTNA